MDKPYLYFAKIEQDSDAKIPTRDASENAGYDIYACFKANYMTIKPLETKLIPTGIASAIDPRYYVQIEERGSTGTKGIKKSSGVMDSSYRGEWFIPIVNTSNKTLLITKNNYIPIYYQDKLEDCIIYPYEKAIAQGIVHEVVDMDEHTISYEELLSQFPSKRGKGALGSSGK